MDQILYNVSDCYPAIQGEGCQSGVPMVILRLQGCGVGCPWCDTKQTWAIEKANQVEAFQDALGDTPKYVKKTGQQVADYIAMQFPTFEWILLTGGEPAEQDLIELVDALRYRGYKVALETSGTAEGHVGVQFDWVCVSPKIGMPGGKTIKASAIRPADEIKFVVGKEADLHKLAAFLQQYPTKAGCTICLQPMSQSPKATQICIEACQAMGYRLSIQIHRYLNQR